MKKELKVGIAGYGVVGPRRREFIDANPHFITTSVCDQRFRDGEHLSDGTICYHNYKELLKEDLDVLFVCMPNNLAPEVTIAGLRRDLHVFCEKPPGRTVEDIKRVIECEQEKPLLKLKYGFNHRYHDSVRDALRMVQSGEFGKIINMRGVYGKSAMIPWPRPQTPDEAAKDIRYWRTSREVSGGGILLDQGIHMVDLMRLFVGQEFKEVKSFVSNAFWKHDVEDNAYALMKTESGIIAMLHSTSTQWRHRFNLEIYLENGALILSGILSGTKSYGQETLKIVYRGNQDNGNPKEQITNYIEDNSWRDEINEFADAIIQNRSIELGNSTDALRSMELVYEIYGADEEWQKKIDVNSGSVL